MKNSVYLITALTACLGLMSCSNSDSDENDSDSDDTGILASGDFRNQMDFFLTSVGLGDGGNLGGLAGADAHCAILAEGAGSIGREWRAYLSTTGVAGENAIERIGEGPWTNANGIIVATSPFNLLDAENNNLTVSTALTENGAMVNGVGDSPNRHDILTGTGLDGMASSSAATDTTCGNWFSNDVGSALVGHHDRVGGGSDPTSWSTAHGTPGCSQANLRTVGGDGLFYCFATN